MEVEGPLPNTRDIILDTALKLAEETSWEDVRLYQIAQQADLSLNDIRQHFREKEELIDAWLDRADQAMLNETERPYFPAISPRERLNRLFMAWLDTLSPHRRIMRQIVFNQIQSGQLHRHLASLLRINRTVQWAREAAQRDHALLSRALDETALTSIYLITFLSWLNDSTEYSRRTRRRLNRLLRLGELAKATKSQFLRPSRRNSEIKRPNTLASHQ